MIVIINCGSTKTPYIQDMVEEYEDSEVIGMFDFDYGKYPHATGFIISGAPILITEKDPEPYLERFTWIKTTEKPVLGICFGHQMLGLTFGALANRQKEDRDLQTIEIITDCPLFDKMASELEFMEDHCESISIPKNFIHVGVSDASINEAMMHESKPLYGVQFHPEVSGNNGAVLFENFVNICLGKTAQAW
jgi:GMP synthase (glutamine-hydrolysing)